MSIIYTASQLLLAYGGYLYQFQEGPLRLFLELITILSLQFGSVCFAMKY